MLNIANLQMTAGSGVIGIIKTTRKGKGLSDSDAELSSQLYDDRPRLGSLSIAELSASLEKTTGKSGQQHQTDQDNVYFYAAS